MHIPENYLSPSTCAVTTVAMIPVWATAVRKVRQSVPQEKMPLLGVAAAFCFLSMMFNIPLPGGTTGHAVCGTLIAILFGPWAAVLAVSIALAIQAVFFGDGGILAFGANCLNMAFVLPFVGYAVYSWLKERLKGDNGQLIAAGIGSYVGLNAAALCAALEFGIQPLLFTDAAGNALYCPYPLSVAIPAMMLGHLTVAGLAEAGFTVGILAFLRNTMPSFGIEELSSGDNKTAPVIGLVCALIAATPLGLLATGDAWGEWGLEDLAELVGYEPAGMANGWEWSSFMPDYSIGALPEWIGYILSAIIGAALLILIFRLLANTSKKTVDFG
ncbi:MAG: cobalt transporter CbiM [Coriobacteriales bacterium]|nr:cobalt transporter CbiM [Coriobacteriales bacterium]MDO5708645.1 cobalt transporter CbiM [Coriobacteriales bacterium]